MFSKENWGLALIYLSIFFSDAAIFPPQNLEYFLNPTWR